ncbi:Glutaredoxin domain-containing protein [Heracleum sosnowskyi]|uniref:Glutaredoxin domain-containing protein n=1 Tax=Heracleum sosnowskyi TaxID=360622 RepID=A0AAD8IPI1_9APIA|nr:Glutaredoxin domain-containing protein [Heracleum sosnowskyi]
MKGMRERLARKLKSISTITNLKQGLVFEVTAVNQCKEVEHANDSLHEMVPYKISLSELINNVEDEDIDQGFHVTERQSYGQPLRPVMDHKEMVLTQEFKSGIFPIVTLQEEIQSLTEQPQACNFQLQTLTENDLSSYNAVKVKSQGLLSFKSLAIAEPAVIEDSSTVNEVMDDVEQYSSLSDFEEICPPGGSNSVILYTTSLRGIRKTFEDCSSIRFLLESFRILYLERDVSMHMEFREELWRIMKGKVVPPRLFIRGRLIGGADEVVRLNEQGKLRKLLEGIPKTAYNCPCHGCAGIHFIVCVNCNGSRKMSVDDQSYEKPVRCPDCNENGLVQCPICS